MTLDDLRKIAEVATEGPWAPWPDQDGTPHMNGLLMVGNADAVIPEGETWIEGVDINPIAHVLTPEDRLFIATFNPKRVLEMIDTLRGAEIRLDHAKTVIDRLQTRLAAVEKLHPNIHGECHTCSNENGPLNWPCPTIRAMKETQND